MASFLLVIASILFVLSCVVDAQSKTAIYFDNGLDQTELDRDMTRLEKKEMELEILNLLGLPNRPRKNNNSLKKSAPRFLLDVYKSLADKENEEHSRSERSAVVVDGDDDDNDADDINLSGDEQNAIEESDVIMTFESINHHVSNVRHEKGKRLWFNVSEVPLAESIVGAELRIYQNENLAIKRAKHALDYTVTVYRLANTDSGERELEHVTAVNTTGQFTGWVSLNLTGCLPTWVAFPDTNKGLYLSVHSTDKPSHEIRPEDIGIVTVKDSEDETQPFMVAYLKAKNYVKSKRSIKEVSAGRRRVKKSHTSSGGDPFRHHGTQGDGGSSSRTCKIRTLYISFKDLQWQDWIIAPDGYAAYYCEGECNFPLNAHMNATNHAIVQTLVHLMHPYKYPKPCCAPTRLTPISVLYFLDDTNVVLKKYKKMVVKSCGCH